MVSVSDFHPTKGPRSGGTKIVMSGSNLDAGSSVDVIIAGTVCNVYSRWELAILQQLQRMCVCITIWKIHGIAKGQIHY